MTLISDRQKQASNPPVAKQDYPDSSFSSSKTSFSSSKTSSPSSKKPGGPGAGRSPQPAPTQPSLLQRFYNLPIGQKQLIALLSSQVLPLLLIVVGSRLALQSGLRNQLFDQAASEVAVTDVNYNIKINQMGFGSRGQADNPDLIAAVQSYNQNQSLPANLDERVRQILKNEVERRKMEYATVVGKDLRIVVNANANRRGETFNPDNLVTAIFADPRQIKASAIVPWSELQQEAPPLPKGFAQQDALIRYTVTAITDPASKQVIGALVFGDIVNAKEPIVMGTLKAFDGGYSAVYQRQNNQFTLATALIKKPDIPLNQAEANVPLPDTNLLQAAVAAGGKPVKGRLTIGGQTFTIAAKAIPNLSREETAGPVPVIKNNAVAVLVRGTPEVAVNSILNQALGQEILIFLVALGVIVVWSVVLRRVVVRPVEELQQTTQRFATGDSQARAEVWARDEVGQLALTFNQMAENIVSEVERNRLIKDITLRINQPLTAGELLNVAVTEIRQAFQTDRVVIYQFDQDWVGTVVAESVAAGWPKASGARIDDPCFRNNWVEAYQKGRVQAVANIDQAGLTPCHLNQLKPFGVKANLVAPIMVGQKLHALLIAHQCSDYRDWLSPEIDLFTQLAAQVGIALDRVTLLAQQQQAKEFLQNRALELLMEVAPLRQGDLTIRAKVTADEIGTIADSYNATINNLREIINQVQRAASQVDLTAADSATSVQELAQDALQQANVIHAALTNIAEMTTSIATVAQNAQATEQAMQLANQTVQEGDVAMNRAMEGILTVRETVTETARKVQQLGASSDKISKVVKLIGAFAAQTNLLALKASIEAARAGEEGRGFVVLADEVRSLAQQSAQATDEIEQLVASIQTDTREVIVAMERGTQQTLTGTELLETTRQNLTRMIQTTEQISQLVQAIAEATTAQSQTSAVVSETMTDVATIANQTSNRSTRVQEAFQNLLTVAEDLQKTVGRFKLS